MKALIICSVHALCDVSSLEREAFNRAGAEHGIPANLTREDHANLLASGTMLDLLTQLPGTPDQRDALTARYLEILNDDLWTASAPAHDSVYEALLDPNGLATATGFVSDYPLLTTNLVRSAALLTNATKLGHLRALADTASIECATRGLAACAAALGVAHADIEVLVAHQRDFDAARSLGMSPRFVDESWPVTRPMTDLRTAFPSVPAAALAASPGAQQSLQLAG